MFGSKRAKLVLVGESGVGKTSIINRFVNKSFSERTSPTIAGASASVLVETESNGELELDIWDTAGQEKYRSVVGVYFRNASAAVLVFDVGQKRSFDELRFWLETVAQCCDSCVLVYLVGNKTDLAHREVSPQEAQLFAQSVKAHSYMECSAKSGQGVDALFEQIINDPGIRCGSSSPESPQKQGTACC